MRGFPRDPYHGNTPLSARADMASTHPASWVALRAIAIAVLAACAVFSGYLAVQAVHDDGLFELEGNIADAPGGAPDWGSMFDANGQPVGDSGGIAAGFLMDEISAGSATDSSVFTSKGTKNNLQPDLWRWGTQSVPAKDDLSNVYAFGTFDSQGHLILYAGLERLAPNGDSHVDLEFNRQVIALDEATPCDNEPCRFLG